ncbi:MAG: FtsX-like permease family protein, partial [FCB group bacterium]
INDSYFKTNNFTLSQGDFFTGKNLNSSESVCIIGYGIKTKLFAAENPIGKSIKCGIEWLTIAGVLQEKNITKENVKNLGIRDYNFDIYIPINTMLLRFVNRSLVTKKDMGQTRFVFSNDEQKKEPPNPNQLDRLVVQVNTSENIRPLAEILGRLLSRRHNQVMDFEIVVPELLLEQEQRTKRIFNVVLGAIASISLIVGGIGIMNIMLASILERIREIGVRRAVGAKEKDIMLQFLCEAIAISLTGGIIGIIVGVVFSYLIQKFTGINSIVSTFSVLLSFIVSISVGLIFGIMPARKAAKQDPIESLRYE